MGILMVIHQKNNNNRFSPAQISKILAVSDQFDKIFKALKFLINLKNLLIFLKTYKIIRLIRANIFLQ
jgi:hypothetical protein